MKTHWLAIMAVTALLGASACQMSATEAESGIGRARMLNADEHPGQWASYSRTWDEQRYSPLDQINDQNAHRLGLAWFDDLDTYRGVQATPLVIDGVLYNETIFNVVTAYNAKTGEKLWVYDPKVGKEWAGLACCGPSSRGLAAWGNKIIIGALGWRMRTCWPPSPARRASMTAR